MVKGLIYIGSLLAGGLVFLFKNWILRRYDDQMNGLCWEFVKILKCNRVIITKYHNGSSGYTGHLDQRMTIVFEVNNGEKPMKPYHQEVPITPSVHRYMTELQEKPYYFFETTEHLFNEKTREYYESSNIRSMYVFPIRVKNRIKYTLGLTWNKMKYLSKAEIAWVQQELILIEKFLK